MSQTARDHYEIYYADKLWNLLPAVYRALDTAQFGTNGPLREMVNRMGATAVACAAASTGCGKTSRSRPATTG